MRAMLSVYDKTGVVDLARGLVDLGWDLVSSGGTAKAIADAGLPVTDVAEMTGFPAILGHRVVTLHPKVHGAILADRTDPSHRAEMEQYGIEAVDLVVSNLYPFGSDPSAFEHGAADPIELVDIGGPALVRSAAKNHAQVGVVVDPSDYEVVLAELRDGPGLHAGTRRHLARKAFAHTAAYDTAVVAWLDSNRSEEEPFAPTLHIAATREPVTLRYGENPHQRAALYRTDGADPWWASMTQHAGLALSYLNLYDADAAWQLVHELDATWDGAIGDATWDGAIGDANRPSCVIVKHANPCGAAVAGTLAEAYRLAFSCDPRSAFGGIVAVNRPIDEDTVAEMVAAAQADVVIAPGYGAGVVDALVAKRKNTRLLEAPAPTPDPFHLRPVTGGYLVQDRHHFATPPSAWQVVTDRRPTAAELADAALAFRLCGWVTSNAIVLVKDGVAWGIGAGQQNRVEAGQIAAQKAAGRAGGGACASDAFYPFADGIEAAAEAGVAVIVQPGGSVRDAECIAKANELGVAMVLTGERHFLH